MRAKKDVVFGHIPQLSFKLRGQLQKFLGIFSPHFSKPLHDFLSDMCYGILSSKNIKISEIARNLREDVSIKKVCERLSRNLKTDALGQLLNELIVRQAAPFITNETLVVIDPTDICKLYAKKRPYLATVRDGSSGTLCQGYWGCAAIACQSGSHRCIPLHLRLWSCEAPDFKSENDEIQTVIQTVSHATQGKGIYVIDRGGDREELFNYLIENKSDFIIRLVGNRYLLRNGRQILAEHLVQRCSFRYKEALKRETPDGTENYEIEYGYMPVSLPEHPDKELYLIGVKGFGQKPMLLLSTLKQTGSRTQMWKVVQGYLSRWRIEETIRYIKQSYDLEAIRFMNYERLKNMFGILLAVVYFSAQWLGESVQLSVLTHHIKEVSLRLGFVPIFHYYALADGIATILSSSFKCFRKQGTLPSIDTSQTILPLFS